MQTLPLSARKSAWPKKKRKPKPWLKKLKAAVWAGAHEARLAQFKGLPRGGTQAQLDDLGPVQQHLQLLAHDIRLDIPDASRQHGHMRLTDLRQGPLEFRLRMAPTQHTLQEACSQSQRGGPAKDAAAQA